MCNKQGKNYFYVTDEGRKKISSTHKGKRMTFSQETRDKISKALKGRVPWSKGKNTQNDERIRNLGKKVSKALKGHVLTTETREKIRIATLNRKPIKCSCLCCKRVFDIGNFIKHINIPRKVSCLCCIRVWDLGSFTQDIRKI